MKKRILWAVPAVLAMILAAPPLQRAFWAAEAETTSVDVSIREKMFIAQTNDIYINADEYMGKTIKLEGLFSTVRYGDVIQYTVTRNGPGCCGNDGVVGFEVRFSEDDAGIPADGDWVEAIGSLERYEMWNQRYLRLALESLRVLDQRGAETVLQ